MRSYATTHPSNEISVTSTDFRWQITDHPETRIRKPKKLDVAFIKLKVEYNEVIHQSFFLQVNTRGSLATELSFRTFAPAAEQKLTASKVNLGRLAQHGAYPPPL